MSAPVRLAFYRGSGLTGWAIRTETWSAFDHVAFLLPDNSVLDVEPDTGVAEHAATRTPDAIRTVAVEPDRQNLALWWARAQIGCRYDWTADLDVVLHRDWREEGAWNCSDLVARAFEWANRPLLNTEHVNRITPGLLLMSPLLVPAS